ncbi:MAG: hypothetical protein KDA69_17910, partial [Planctomycetaceae bacterium]|nr:hypothetical protein [Planctomycetaceae bacterium]
MQPREGDISTSPVSVGQYFMSGSVLGKRKYLSMANMELYFLLRGRNGIPGRWGTDTVAGQYADIAGGTFEDVNFNGILDMGEDLNGNGRLDGDEDFDYFLGGREHLDRYVGNVVQPPFVHPLDYRGLAYFPDSGNVQRNSYLRSVTTFNNLPGVWPDYGSYYGQYWENEGGGTETLHGVDTIREAASGALQPGGIAGLVNEPDRMIHENSFRHTTLYRNDSDFGPAETAALRLTDRDTSVLGQESIVKNLASFNLRDNTQAATIRQQFTTTSFDRNEFSFNYWPTRSWEFNDQGRFPPAFGPAGISSRHEFMPVFDPAGTPSAAPINTSDPFRPVVRRLLTIDRARQSGGIGGGRLLPQNRLDINRLLVNFDPDGNPIYRELMPHPVFASTDTDTNGYLDNAGTPRPMYHGNAVTGFRNVDEDHPAVTLSDLDPNIPSQSGGTFPAVTLNTCNSDKFAQEVWARYDRQRLARDIFVLLYTLGGVDPTTGDSRDYAVIGHDLADTTDADGDGMYDVRQRIREMAQFAVNYVDALDRDNVITRFEFDYDLTDGWDIPSNADPSTDNDPNNDTYGWVYGVEEVSLTLSEALVIRAKTQGTDLQKTLHNDVDGTFEEHRFLYLE